MRAALFVFLALMCAAAQAQNPATLVGTWAINRGEAGTGPGGFEYDSLRWVRRHAADGTGSVELRFYKDEKPVLTHRETGTWGLKGATYWFQCATATREGAVLPCNRRNEYGVLRIDAGTFMYRAAGSELIHNLARVADNFELP
jgi:hypothetical protein